MKPKPKLAPPGAGLPLVQRIALRLILGPIISKIVPLEKTRLEYEKLVQLIIKRVEEIPLEKRSTRILVKPIPGLEDSSRYWSINGVLEHLLIVDRSMERVILALAAGEQPAGKADVAAVKPQHFETDYLTEFKAYAPDLIARLDDATAKPGMNLHSPLTFQHPWFGAFSARQWRWILAGHQAVHSTQIKEIMKQLE
jgi:hypothetical protein